MSLETGLISFAALSSLALAMRRHRSGIALRVLPSPAVARIVGWTLLVLSAVVAASQGGVGVGLTTWVGQLCVAAPLLVLLMSWRPNTVPALAIAALACAFFLAPS